MKAAPMDLMRANVPGAAWGMAMLAVAALGLVAVMQYLDGMRQTGAALDERESAIARQEQQRQAISKAHRTRNDPHAAALMAQQRYAVEPARQLIEDGWRPDIAFLSLEVKTATREITMIFETRSVQEALSYADWIEAQPATENLVVKRQVEKPGPPVRSVETTLQVTWRAFQPGAARARLAPASAPAPSVAPPAAASPGTGAAP